MGGYEIAAMTVAGIIGLAAFCKGFIMIFRGGR